MGKLSAKDLQEMLNCIRPDPRVIVQPMIGYDSGVHKIVDRYLVVAADPCTGVPEEWFGYLLINYAASDLALSGAKPEFCTINLLAPRPTAPEVFQKIMKQTCQAADELDIAIVRGHTGMYDSVKDMLGVCTVYGTVNPEKLKTSGGAKAGDLIFCTKPLGVETVTNFSLTNKELSQKFFGLKKQQEYAKLVPMQNCVKEALQLTQIEEVHAMHDATEGGFVAALNELAGASKVGFRVDWEKIPVPTEVLALKAHFGLSDDQMLAMSSTGTILGAVEPDGQEKVRAALEKNGLSAYFLGEFTGNQERILIKKGKAALFPRVAEDPYTQILLGKYLLFHFFQYKVNYFFGNVDFCNHLQALPTRLAIHVNDAWPIGSFKDVYASDFAADCLRGFYGYFFEFFADGCWRWFGALAIVSFPSCCYSTHRSHNLVSYDKCAYV
jgi:hydrogenase expression/formation protein HypE